jgi:hypothetical protein
MRLRSPHLVRLGGLFSDGDAVATAAERQHDGCCVLFADDK